MSVYTQLSAEDIRDFLNLYDLGDYRDHQGISAGVENTNYFVTTEHSGEERQFVLTLFEHHNTSEVETFIRIGRHLAGRDVPVPGPEGDRDGRYLHILADKPAILCPRMPGGHSDNLTPEHCSQIGAALARFHISGEGLEGIPENNRGLRWWPEIARQVIAGLDDEQQEVLADEIEYQESCIGVWQSLPAGLIHGDLFHDNALFEGDDLGAILDIYNACHDAWLIDLAIVANDWCAKVSGVWHEDKLQALLDGYQTVRALTEEELGAWNMCLRAAALRFWLSRLWTQQIQQKAREADPFADLTTTEKDPMEYFLKLLRHRDRDEME